MQTDTLLVRNAALPVIGDARLPPTQATDMERLALALLGCAQKCEIEAGLVVQITPALTLEACARLAGIGDYSAALLVEYLLEAGIVIRRRQRFLLVQPAGLQRLALGAAPV